MSSTIIANINIPVGTSPYVKRKGGVIKGPVNNPENVSELPSSWNMAAKINEDSVPANIPGKLIQLVR